MEVAAETGGTLNILITFFLGISLKALWLFMNQFQIIAYLKHAQHKPANLETILQSVYDAVHLTKRLKWKAFEAYMVDKTKFIFT